jgi:hypothetical protein
MRTLIWRARIALTDDLKLQLPGGDGQATQFAQSYTLL